MNTALVARLVKRDGPQCQHCGHTAEETTEGYLVPDHVVPTGQGGGNEDANRQLLCVPCNSAKGALHPNEDKDVRHASAVVQAGFTIIPNAVLFAPALSLGAKVLYGVLKHYAWLSSADWPGQDALAALLGVTPKTLRGYVDELVAVSLVRCKRRGRGATNAYVIDEPSAALLLSGKKYRSATVANGPSTTVVITDPSVAAKTLGEDNAVSSTQHGAATAGSSKPKRVDLLWDVFDDLLGGVTNDTERGKRNRALKAIRQSLQADGVADAQLQAAALRARVLRAQQAWGTRGITVTELAVAGNWRVLGASNDVVATLTAQEIYDMTREVA